MKAELMISVISLLGTLLGSFMGIFVSNKLVNYRLDALEKNVEKLCCLAERVTVVEHEVNSVINRTNRQTG